MKHTLRCLSAAFVLVGAMALTALPASAATGSWTIDTGHWTIYSDGGFATMTFTKPQTQVPNNTSITSTQYKVSAYPNGNTVETVQMCYRQQFTTTDFPCSTIGVTGASTLTTHVFDGLSARGTIAIKHTISGGSYPATGTGQQDTVTLTYSY